MILLVCPATGDEPGAIVPLAHTTETVTAKTYYPFDPAPEIALPTTSGLLAIGGGRSSAESYILISHVPQSPQSQAIWNGSVDLLLARSPRSVHYVFMSTAEVPPGETTDMAKMRQRVVAAIARHPSEADQSHWTAHTHFVTVNPLTLNSPVSALLTQWGSPVAHLQGVWRTADGGDGQIAAVGLTAANWTGAATGPVTGRLARYGHLACGREPPVDDLKDRIALIERGVCPFAEKANAAERAGAVAVIFYTDEREKTPLSGYCRPCPGIPAAIIDRQPGLELRAAVDEGLPVTATLSFRRVSVPLLAIDPQGRLREAGTIPYPFNRDLDSPLDNLQLVAYEAQYLDQERQLDSRLRTEDASGRVRVVPVFTGEWAADPDWSGRMAFAAVQLPSATEMAGYDTLEIDHRLACDGARKADCPPWDYINTLYLCDAGDPLRCDIELARYITPYGSGGRWVTNLSPLLGLLAEGGKRRFAYHSAQRYRADISLRFSNRSKALVPMRAERVLQGGIFWQDYNRGRNPVRFRAPPWAQKIELAVLLTGHGHSRDAANCAEFCNHTHHIAVNGGQEYVRGHPEAGAPLGCADRVPAGVVPNQAGTWVYGRAGWCPGLDVPLWVIDITGDVRRGQWNELTYRALVDGQDYGSQPGAGGPPAEGYDARIDLTAYFIYYAPPGQQVEQAGGD